jgi:hypothetical protein
MSEEPREPQDAPPSATSTLFDLRTIIAVLFGVYGLVLLAIGLWGTDDAARAKSGGTNINLWTGLAMVIVAGLFYAWVRLRPLLPPSSEDTQPAAGADEQR